MSAKSGVNTHFEVSDMLYGITQPIYRVELTDPNGDTSELTKIDDWYLIGDTFVLYNDNTDHLTFSGNYTLTIYANGFKKFNKTFYASGADNQQVVLRRLAQRQQVSMHFLLQPAVAAALPRPAVPRAAAIP